MKYLEPAKFKKIIDTTIPKILFVFENENCAVNEDDINGFNNGHNVGFDLRTNEDIEIDFNNINRLNDLPLNRLISTGCKWAAPVGIELEIVPRSGISLNTHFKISNTPGTIEPTYRGEIKVIFDYSIHYMLSRLLNIGGDINVLMYSYKSIHIYSNGIKIDKNTKIAQAKIKPYIQYINKYGSNPIDVYFTIDEDIFNDWENICPSERGSKGFGSTG